MLLDLSWLFQQKDSEVTLNTLTAWFYLTEQVDARFEVVVATIPIAGVVQCLVHDFPLVPFTALHLAGNICMGPQKFVDRLLATDILAELIRSLQKPPTEEWLQECLLLFSNVACGESRNVQRLLERGVIGHLCDVLSKSPLSIPVPLQPLSCI